MNKIKKYIFLVLYYYFARFLPSGKFGKFVACPSFPNCKNTKTLDENGNVVEKKVESPKTTDKVCSKCGKPMVIRSGRYGEFLACSGYPKCKNIENIPTNFSNKEHGGDK